MEDVVMWMWWREVGEEEGGGDVGGGRVCKSFTRQLNSNGGGAVR